MSHIVFAFYLLSLFSGIFLLSRLMGEKREALVQSYNAFAINYSVIFCFVCISALCLYLHINLPSPYLLKSYISVIFLFLAALPISTTHYHRVRFELTFPSWFKPFLWVQLAFCLVLAALVWWLPAHHYGLLLTISIGMMIASVISNNYFAASSVHHLSRSLFAKRLSTGLIVQSVSLPLLEAVFFGDHLASEGVTYSLPLVFLVNNLVLWKYQDQLISFNQAQPTQSVIFENLSPKEREIAVAVSKGLSNKQIAFELSISPSTVKNHLYNIFKKCQVTNRVELVTKLQQ